MMQGRLLEAEQCLQTCHAECVQVFVRACVHVCVHMNVPAPSCPYVRMCICM